jgi:uncharacterized membrane protein required for colicin V production
MMREENKQMNLVTVIVLAVTLLKAVQGYKRGMVREVISFVTLIVMSILVILLSSGLKSYIQKEIVGVIVTILLLSILGIAHHFLGLFFFSAKMLSKLPVIHSIDKLLGFAVGMFETVLIVWTIYAFIRISGIGMIGQMILAYTEKSPVLLWLFRNNLLIGWIEKISGLIPFTQF